MTKDCQRHRKFNMRPRSTDKRTLILLGLGRGCQHSRRLQGERKSMRHSRGFFVQVPSSFSMVLAIVACGVALAGDLPDATHRSHSAHSPLSLHIRKRVETQPGSTRFHAVTEEVAWDPAKTAIVVCDMWNEHWCKGATRRVAEMAPRMNDVLVAARNRGVLIIHCPSSTMKFYEGTEQRERAHRVAHVATKPPLRNSCSLDAKREGRLPIDDS